MMMMVPAESRSREKRTVTFFMYTKEEQNGKDT